MPNTPVNTGDIEHPQDTESCVRSDQVGSEPVRTMCENPSPNPGSVTPFTAPRCPDCEAVVSKNGRCEECGALWCCNNVKRGCKERFVEPVDTCPKCHCTQPYNKLARRKRRRGPDLDPDHATGELLKIRHDAEQFRDRVLRDKGDPDPYSVKGNAVARLAELGFHLDVITHYLVAHGGPLTPTGQVRPAYTVLLQTLAEWKRFAQLVGLDVAEKVLQTPQEWLQTSTPASTDSTDELAAQTPTEKQPQSGDS